MPTVNFYKLYAANDAWAIVFISIWAVVTKYRVREEFFLETVTLENSWRIMTFFLLCIAICLAFEALIRRKLRSKGSTDYQIASGLIVATVGFMSSIVVWTFILALAMAKFLVLYIWGATLVLLFMISFFAKILVFVGVQASEYKKGAYWMYLLGVCTTLLLSFCLYLGLNFHAAVVTATGIVAPFVLADWLYKKQNENLATKA